MDKNVFFGKESESSFLTPAFENEIIVIVFFSNFYLKSECEMNLRIKMKNDAADPEIGFLEKSISKPFRLTSLFRPRGC